LTAANQSEIAPVSEILKLLADFWSGVLIARVEATQMLVEGVNIIDFEFSLADGFDALHDFDQPAARLQGLRTQEQRPLPLGQHRIFWLRNAVLQNVDFSGIGNLVEQDF